MLYDVRILVQVHFASRGHPGEQGQLIGKGSRWYEEGFFLAGELGGAFLKKIDGGIFPEDIIADFGAGHGFSHGFRGKGYGVGAVIDHFVSVPKGGRRFHLRRERSS